MDEDELAPGGWGQIEKKYVPERRVGIMGEKESKIARGVHAGDKAGESRGRLGQGLCNAIRLHDDDIVPKSTRLKKQSCGDWSS